MYLAVATFLMGYLLHGNGYMIVLCIQDQEPCSRKQDTIRYPIRKEATGEFWANWSLPPSLPPSLSYCPVQHYYYTYLDRGRHLTVYVCHVIPIQREYREEPPPPVFAAQVCTLLQSMDCYVH